MAPLRIEPRAPAAASGAEAPAVGAPRQKQPFTVTLFATSVELGPQELRVVGIFANFDTTTNPHGTVPGTAILTVEGLPSGVTGVIDPVEIAPPADSNLILTASGAVQPGTYHLTVKGTLALINTADGTQTYREDSASLDLVVRPFSLVLPASVTVQPGGSAQVP